MKICLICRFRGSITRRLPSKYSLFSRGAPMARVQLCEDVKDCPLPENSGVCNDKPYWLSSQYHHSSVSIFLFTNILSMTVIQPVSQIPIFYSPGYHLGHVAGKIHIIRQKTIYYMYFRPCRPLSDTYNSAENRLLYVLQTLPTAAGYI